MLYHIEIKYSAIEIKYSAGGLPLWIHLMSVAVQLIGFTVYFDDKIVNVRASKNLRFFLKQSIINYQKILSFVYNIRISMLFLI